ncbi:PepSY-associated TM helix domain-containing protein [Ketobacter sp.]|uniref:PepSY-associated TM helix domain-containing protein n=1 Tax=Ketobacter sp. TaxID=2083498 RepID=UPI000F1834A2|nr:PepSY-associated TM helix domain-containing protein [Ketobacter sp.]RLU01572.1 MAG: PepSY domain-containing protein [Ketobacter sp.]
MVLQRARLNQWARLYKGVHTWTGIVAGMALFIAFYAGALTVFKAPLERWASPPANTSAWVDVADTQALIQQTLAQDPTVADEFFIHLHPLEHRPAAMAWMVAAEGADEHDQLAQVHYQSFFDGDGELVIEQASPSPLAEFLDVLHRVVGLPFDTEYTRWVMGIFAVLYALALFSGLVVVLPTFAKDILSFRLGKNRKRMWLDAHNVVGIVSLPFHVIIALTAVGFAFHDGIYMAQDKVVHDGTLIQSFRSGLPAPDPSPKEPADLLPPAKILAQVEALAPEFEPTMLQYLRVTSPMPAVRVWGNDQQGMGARAWGSFAILHPYSGEVLNTDYLPSHQAAAFTAINTIFSLHFVTFGGTLEKWIYFILALAGAWLFYTGNLLWVESRRRSQKPRQPLPVQRGNARWLASATVGVCLGAVCGMSATIAATKWMHGWVDNLLLGHQLVYYVTFFLAIAWAFTVGAARASVQLLWVAAALTLSIAASSLLGWAGWVPAWWSHGSVAALGVDAMAVMGAACFGLMAMSTAKRVYSGSADSVWTVEAPAVTATD